MREIKGRLKENISFWKYINASDFVIDIIENGYRIPFYSSPQITDRRNNRSAISNGDFVESAIRDLVLKGLVVVCEKKPTVVSPLSVASQASGKKRLILDLSLLNKHVWKCSVKYEDWRTALMYINKNDWLVKFDIHSAYHHIDIFEPHTDYLGFSWGVGENRTFYKFVVLPFGLTTAPYVFTKVTRQLVKHWRSKSYKCVTFIDDGIMTGDSLVNARVTGLAIKNDLIDSGFVPKVEKSLWEPCQVIEWLGLVIDTKIMMLSIPTHRLEKLTKNGDAI